MNAIDILCDAASRPAAAARDALGPVLSGEGASDLVNAHLGGHPNSVTWLLWHAAREIDSQVSALSGSPEVWTAVGFADRTGLAHLGDSMGYGMDDDEARDVRTEDPAALLDYLDAATDALTAYLRTLREADLGEVIDESWDPPVTRGVRLVSVIDDAAQHVGQIAYIIGAPELA